MPDALDGARGASEAAVADGGFAHAFAIIVIASIPVRARTRLVDIVFSLLYAGES